VSTDPFLTLADSGAAELRVRGSLFRSLAFPTLTEDDAKTRLAEEQRRAFDASHRCSAWILRAGTRRANDAGEPCGSAGAPILAAMEGASLVDAGVLVTRYFGGTKLGVDGLVRAYGEAAAAAVSAAPRQVGIPAARLSVRYAYGHTGVVMRVLERTGPAEAEHGFASDGGSAELRWTVARALVDTVIGLLREGSCGTLTAEWVQERVLYRPVTEGWRSQTA
jgi:putative IMPACT (imprinted ancient) family translation regulator